MAPSITPMEQSTETGLLESEAPFNLELPDISTTLQMARLADIALHLCRNQARCGTVPQKRGPRG
jgi:hypothetical protein|tara:strand:- start:193 stop:387 length:195 start_codon:yes stop_codon:yes gene_type:complete